MRTGGGFGVRIFRGRFAVAIALFLIAQIPAQAIGLDGSTNSSSIGAPAAASMPCGSKPPVDPPLWEQSLPTASVSSAVSATDQSCVREIGRSANGVVWQQPDGALSARTYSQPVNFKAADGSWQPIDTRLVADGKAGTVNRAGPFSAHFGNDAAAASLVQIESPQGSVSFHLNGAQTASDAVTAPSTQATGAVSGDGSDTLTYAGALPGVDVRYQVLMHAVKEAIVLNHALSANTLPEFRFAVTAKGLTASTATDGTVQFADAKGVVAFAMAPGQAYDANGESTSVSYTLVPSSDPNVSELSVSIDAKWLGDPARVYPVTIDPSLSQPEAFAADTYVANGSNANTNFYFYSQWDSTLGEFVDNAGVATGVTYRSLQNFDLSGLTGAYIVSAHWHGYAYAVSGTTPVALTLQPINSTSTWDPSTVTWNTQPTLRTSTASSGGYSGAGWQSADIKTWLQNYASGTWTNNGIEISGPTNGRAQLAAAVNDDPHFSYVDVTYDAYPQVNHMSAGGQLNTWIANTSTPTLSAEVDDSDTTSGLYAHFEVWNNTHTAMITGASGDGSHVSSGDRSTWTAPTLADGSYTFRVRANDATAQSNWFSYWFPLTVDTVSPSAPGTSSTTWTANTWNTSAPSSGTFTLSNGGSSDVTGYYYGLDEADSPSTYTASASSTVTLKPETGWHDLVVRSQDHAGNLSTPTHLLFGQGSGGLSSPAPDARTGKNFVVTFNSTTGYDGVTLQYRHSESDTWSNIPTADVTFKSSGTGIGSWPVHCTGWTTCTGTTGYTYPALVWNAMNTLGAEGPVQLQGVFWTGATIQPTITTTTRNMAYDPNQFGSSYATAPIGPGSVNLLSGNFSIGSSDVGQGDLHLSRYFNSREPNWSHGFLGPGWRSTMVATSVSWQSISDNTTDVVVSDASGGMTAFRQQPDGSYRTENGSTLLSLVKCTSGGTSCNTNLTGRFELKLLGFETWGFQQPTGGTDYTVVDVKASASGGLDTTSWAIVNGVAAPTQEVASPPPGVVCTSAPLTTRGCRVLTFSYGGSTTATGSAEANWGDYLNQLKTVSYTAWDPDLVTPAMHTVAVATYLYDNTGHLRAAWDPRVSTPLKTRYAYNGNGQIATFTPAGLQPWTMNYAPIGSEPSTVGRLANVQRPTLDSGGAVNGTATATVVYQIPLTVSGGGPYDMLPSNTASWAQTDNPTDATALYPPDQTPSGTPPSSYTRATVTYVNIDGQAVNVAAPGGEITTNEHDATGNEIRTLSAGNRERALASSTDPTQQAANARLVDSQSVYDSNGRLTDTYGPAHVVDLPDGTARPARAHAHNVYDQGAPGGTTYNLVTTATKTAAPTDGSAEQDSRTTSYAYAIGSDTSGWSLGTSLQATVDPGSSPHLNLTTTTLYDTTTGQPTQRRLPGNPSGGDAHSTVFVSYTADGSSSDANCRNRPEWATLPCKQAPAAQPGTSGLPNLKTTYVTKYNSWGEPEETQDKDIYGTTLRTTDTTYDAVGRPTSQAISGATGSGATVATSTMAYDTNTGLTTTTSDGTRTITRAYDTLGRMTSYTDADADTTTYTYDALDRPSTVNDGKATTTYTYNDVGSEQRGLLTTVSDSSIGTFTATYNADGQLATQVVPGGLTATHTYDESGEPTGLKYTKGSGFWPNSTARYNIHGERTFTTSDLFIYNYTYDGAGRLINTDEQNVLGCQRRAYTFDSDTNRTALTTTIGVTWNSNPANCPPTGTGTTTSYSYDSADRITGTGYTYDTLGRTTAMPATNSPSGYATTLGYYTNDLVNTITSNSTTLTYNLDPNRRVRTWSSSADSQNHTNHYTGDGDTPAWTSENTTGTNWTRNLSAFGGMTASTNQSGAITLELTNIHGDIIGPSATTDSTWNLSVTQSETDEYGRTKGGTGIRYDYLGTAERQRDTNSALQLMGQRVYNPSTGRFLQTDSVLGGSANDYDYVAGDPVGGTDTSGQCPRCPPRCLPFSANWFGSYRTGARWAPCSFFEKKHYYPIIVQTKAGQRAEDPHGNCSVPFVGNLAGSAYFYNFHNACNTHDYMYDLLRVFWTLIVGNYHPVNRDGQLIREVVDFWFVEDMYADCLGRGAGGIYAPFCEYVADEFYSGVHLNTVYQELNGSGKP